MNKFTLIEQCWPQSLSPASNQWLTKAPRRFAATLLFLALASFARGACPNGVCVAIDASYVEVNAAVTRAANGDTVQIPAGTAIWTSTLNVGAKRISIIGAGSSSTVITNGRLNGPFASGLIRFSPNSSSALIRLSGIGIVSPLSTSDYSYMVSVAGPARVRIDHCKFTGGEYDLSFNFDQSGTGRVTGVVDHNEFLNCNVAVAVFDKRATDGSNAGSVAWSETTQPGTDTMMCYEDNLFHFTSIFSNQDGDAAQFYGQYGGRVVIRHNQFGTSSADSFAQDWIDAHGDGPGYSIVFYEVYNNTFYEGTIGLGAGAMANLRGGQAIYHDNVFHSTKVPIQLVKYWPTDVHIVTNTFWYNNTWNASTNQSAQVQNDSPSDLHENTNYFLRAIQSGDAWYPYTTLVYPHPLVSGGPTPTPAPTPTGTPAPTATPTATVTPTPTPLGLSFPATAGVITSPFVITGNTVSQPVDTDDPTQGGRASYTFNVPTSGDYLLSALVSCPDGGSNSFFVNIDAEPSSTMIWSIPLTSGFELRIASWYPSTTPKIWTLNAGTHQLIVRGREANTLLQSFTFAIPPQPPQGLHVVP